MKMGNQFKTPEYIEKVLKHLGFKPEAKEVREDFAQWRKDVGKPTELYADVYKKGLLKLYTRTGLINFPNGSRPNFLVEKFEGYIEDSGDLVRLMHQTRIIDKATFNATVALGIF